MWLVYAMEKSLEASCSSMTVYLFCKVCKLNHSQLSKHRFSMRHRQQLVKVLKGYGKKIKDSKQYLQMPKVLDGEYEPGSKFWCHFCEGQFIKHVSDREKSVLYAGVFEHLASENHWHKTDKFFLENGADKKYKASFIVSKLDFIQYKEKISGLLTELEQKEQQELKLSSKQISMVDEIRAGCKASACESVVKVPEVLYKTAKNKYGVLQNPTGWHDGVRVWGGGIVKYKAGTDQWIPWELDDIACRNLKDMEVETDNINAPFHVEAFSNNLTKIQIPFLSNGNVHTGAVPPWQRHDGDDDNQSLTSRACIGPSEELFLKHLERRGKVRKANPNRVGANFDHSINDHDDWLPSFGGVWNEGPRWLSRVAYRHLAKKRSKAK